MAPERYAVALIGVALIIGGVVMYIRQTDRAIEQSMRQWLLKQQQAGTLPPELQGIDLQTMDLSKVGDFQMSLPAAAERRLKLSYFLTDFWYIWGPLVVLLCLVAAALVGAIRKPGK